jgi:hypothetical protein
MSRVLLGFCVGVNRVLLERVLFVKVVMGVGSWGRGIVGLGEMGERGK